MSIEQRFGMRLKQLRLQCEMSQEELSFASGLSKNYISDVERGKRNVSLKAIESLSKGLDVPIYELFYFR